MKGGFLFLCGFFLAFSFFFYFGFSLVGELCVVFYKRGGNWWAVVMSWVGGGCTGLEGKEGGGRGRVGGIRSVPGLAFGEKEMYVDCHEVSFIR